MFTQAMTNYKKGNYAEAIENRDTLLKAFSQSDTLSYFLGAACQALDDTEIAIDFFEKVTTLPEGKFTFDTNWYLGLIFLKKGDTHRVNDFLIEFNHPDRDELLEKLRYR